MIPFALPRRLVSVLAEETTLKWTALASAVGVLAGPATAAFLTILNWAMETMQQTPVSLLWLPVGFVPAHLLVTTFAPEAEGHGTDKVIEAVHRRGGQISLAVAPVPTTAIVHKLFATA
jgi:H+/Cl- antiporter ClcA